MNASSSTSTSIPQHAFLPAVVGFDGFVDEIASVVAERTDVSGFRRVERIGDFGAMIVAASGRSFGREFVISRVEGGGNGPNLAEGLVELGITVHLFGTLGNPIQPAFEMIAARCASCTSIGSGYGKTLALEFADGKLMMNETSGLADFDEAVMHRLIDAGGYTQACRGAGLIAFANWSRYPHMTACWKAASDRVLATLTHRPWVMVDLADPSNRKPNEICDMLSVVSSFQRRCRTVLGINLSEAGVIQGVLGCDKPMDEANSMESAAAALRDRLDIHAVIVHSQRRAAAAWRDSGSHGDGSVCIDGNYVSNPVRTTGVGDRFNAGVCAGLLSGKSMPESVSLGCKTGSWFVRTGTNITLNQLL